MASPALNLTGPVLATVAPSVPVVPIRPSMGIGPGVGLVGWHVARLALVLPALVAPRMPVLPVAPVTPPRADWDSMAWRYARRRRGWQIYPRGNR